MKTTPRTLALHARLARRFDLVTEPVAVGPLRVTFTRVADPQKVLDDLCAKIDLHEKASGQRVAGDQLGLPYWAELWDSAVGMGAWLIEHDSWLKKRPDPQSPVPATRVMDLGCGMGLSGTVAAMKGADVLFADYETACLPFAQLNGRRYSDRVRSRKVNWQTDRLGEQFDVLLGSDVLYDKTQWRFLVPFFDAHLAPGGAVLLGEPGRQSGDLFIPWIETQGWTLRHREQKVPTRTTPIRLFELKRA